MNKNRLKSFSISTLLLVVCLILNIMKGGVASSGAGNGFDSKVETVEDLALLLEFLGAPRQADQVSEAYYSGNAVLLSDMSANEDANSSDKDATEENAPINKHTSATVHLSTNLYSSTHSNNYKYTNNIIAANQTLLREMTVYITESATHYVSKGIATSYMNRFDVSENKKVETTTYLQFDVEIVLFEDNEYIYMRDMIISDNESSMNLKKANKEVWFKLPYGLASDLVDIDYENRELLSSMQELVDILVKYDMFENNEKTARLTEDDFADIIEKEGDSSPDFKDSDLSVTIDISNPKKPRISSASHVDTQDTSEIIEEYMDYYPFDPIYTTVTITKESRLTQEIAIQNIDNTVVRFDNEKAKELSDENDFEKLFIIERSEKDE